MLLQIELNDEQLQRFEEISQRLNVSASDLAKAAINDLIAKQEIGFERAAKRVLTKNAELYKRLV